MQEASFYSDYYEICLKNSAEIRKCCTTLSITENMIQNVESGLEPIDYIYAILLGVVGAFITSSKKIDELLNEIHQIASETPKASDDKVSKLIKVLLGHNKDYMDSVPVIEGQEINRKYATRLAEEAGNAYILNGGTSGPHRIFWGHDILSFHKDNPFFLMQKQYPGVKGVIQAIKHLTADTFSKQGLPIPTTSWWDYTYKNANGVTKVGNKLLDFCNRMYKDLPHDKVSVTTFNNDIFNHMFSIHIQDITVQSAEKVLCKVYFKIRNITDTVIQHQFKLISFSVLFYMNSLIGAVKYKIPYINWIAGSMMVKELVELYCASNMETYRLEQVTKKIIERTAQLENRVNYTDDFIKKNISHEKE